VVLCCDSSVEEVDSCSTSFDDAQPEAVRVPTGVSSTDLRAEREVPMGEMTIDEAGMVFVDPAAYADEDQFHRACTVLSREAPIHRVEHPQFNPFYAVTRYADVLEVESHPDVFQNAPRGILQVAEADQLREAQGDVIRTPTHMDGSEHRAHRAVTADWFLPKGLGR
jgi:hypothetical protein